MADDLVLPFAVEALDLRGRVVRLGSSIDSILTGHDYPVVVSDLLGQAVALAKSGIRRIGRMQRKLLEGSGLVPEPAA